MQITSNRFSDIARQRQSRITAAFSMEDDLACSPVNIVELKSLDLAAAKPESHQQKHDGEVPPTHVGPAVATAQKLLKFSWRNELRETGLSPASNGRYGVRKLASDGAT